METELQGLKTSKNQDHRSGFVQQNHNGLLAHMCSFPLSFTRRQTDTHTTLGEQLPPLVSVLPAELD